MKSCVICKQSAQNDAPFNCVVQSETDAIIAYEVHLDDKLVSSGRAMPKEKDMTMLKLAANTGDYTLTVTAPGCETWQKTITVMGNIEKGQFFLVESEKSGK